MPITAANTSNTTKPLLRKIAAGSVCSEDCVVVSATRTSDRGPGRLSEPNREPHESADRIPGTEPPLPHDVARQLAVRTHSAMYDDDDRQQQEGGNHRRGRRNALPTVGAVRVQAPRPRVRGARTWRSTRADRPHRRFVPTRSDPRTGEGSEPRARVDGSRAALRFAQARTNMPRRSFTTYARISASGKKNRLRMK